MRNFIFTISIGVQYYVTHNGRDGWSSKRCVKRWGGRSDAGVRKESLKSFEKRQRDYTNNIDIFLEARPLLVLFKKMTYFRIANIDCLPGKRVYLYHYYI